VRGRRGDPFGIIGPSPGRRAGGPGCPGKDVKLVGDETPPEGPILAVRTADLHEKEAILAANPDAFFTIPHFNGYKAYLIQLARVTPGALREALTDGWLAVAPPSLAGKFHNLHP
jgi:hypothetical protein